MIDDILSETSAKMEKAIEAFKKELASIRTGRASTALVDGIKADYHGVPTPLSHMATITTPEARLLIIQPWDRTALPAIEKAIQKSDLGLNPANDGNMIRLAIPVLSEERRRELVKIVHKRVEERRVAIRNIRRSALEEIRELERSKDISQDEQRRAQERLQQITDSFIKDVDQVGKDKEEELLSM
ncbi:MAG: ribosome recycling factor [Chloroflexota bacterium]|nr:ribosome recycling factor [Chloroflexota bacterium]